MTEDSVLDGLMEVFPEVNFSTLIEVSIQFKDDIDAAADYIIQNALPNIAPDPSHPNTNGDLSIHGHQQAFDDSNTHTVDPVDNNTTSSCVQFDQPNLTTVEKQDSHMVKQLKQPPTGLYPEVFGVPSTSGQNHVSGESSSDSLLAGSDSLLASSQLQHTSSERNTEISDSEGDMSLHDNGSPRVNLRSSYAVDLESLDTVIAHEHYKKNTLMSNVAAISEMLQEVELNEENTKLAISEASQAGNDILAKVEELKEMTTLAVEENKKVEGEIFAEKSILATEAQGLQTRLFNISEETKSFLFTIDQMHNTLQRRLHAAEAERAAAEKEKLERVASAQKSLKDQELLLEAAKNESKRLEQQAKENAKLRELLTDRGHVVDALHGEMLGIFDSITQLKLRADIQSPVDEQWQHVSSSLSSSAVGDSAPFVLSSSAFDEPLQQVPFIMSRSTIDEAPSSLTGSFFDGPLQQISSRLSSSVRTARSNSSLDESLGSKNRGASALESNASLMNDERIADVSDGNFALDDSWDVVDDENIEYPTSVLKSTPMLL
ncbi:hypothetical protein U9M48_043863 [Paspalum notatum var. saurae]|uniref:CUE domain-containing protein n=1 Tax=Paspalum notatum var. saurae TaxID=547442 RepID=A0AAQ3UTN1_PASNO